MAAAVAWTCICGTENQGVAVCDNGECTHELTPRELQRVSNAERWNRRLPRLAVLVPSRRSDAIALTFFVIAALMGILTVIPGAIGSAAVHSESASLSDPATGTQVSAYRLEPNGILGMVERRLLGSEAHVVITDEQGTPVTIRNGQQSYVTTRQVDHASWVVHRQANLAEAVFSGGVSIRRTTLVISVPAAADTLIWERENESPTLAVLNTKGPIAAGLANAWIQFVAFALLVAWAWRNATLRLTRWAAGTFGVLALLFVVGTPMRSLAARVLGRSLADADYANPAGDLQLIGLTLLSLIAFRFAAKHLAARTRALNIASGTGTAAPAHALHRIVVGTAGVPPHHRIILARVISALIISTTGVLAMAALDAGFSILFLGVPW